MNCTYFPYSQANGLPRLLLVAMVHVHGLGASFKLVATAICGQEAMTCCAVGEPQLSFCNSATYGDPAKFPRSLC